MNESAHSIDRPSEVTPRTDVVADFIFELAGFDEPNWKKGEPMGARFATSAPRGYHLHEWLPSRDGMTLVICWERDFI